MKTQRVKFFTQNFTAWTSLFLAVFFFICFILPFFKSISPLFLKAESSFNTRNLFGTIAFTFKTSLLSTTLALLLGIISALLAARGNLFFKNFLLCFSCVPLCVPALIMAIGYISIFGVNGTASRFIRVLTGSTKPVTFLYSFWGIVTVQGFYNFPLVMSGVCDALKNLNRTHEEAASLLGASKCRIFFSVTLFKIIPAVISSLIPVFLYCFFSFIIVLMFSPPGSTTLEVSVYTLTRARLDFRGAALLCLIETLCAGIILFLYSLAEKKALKAKDIFFLKTETQKTIPSRIEKFFASVFFVIIVIFFLLPLFSIIFDSFFIPGKNSLSLKFWKELFLMKGFFKSLFSMFAAGVFTAVFSTAAAFFYSAFISRIKKEKTILKIIPLLPMTVSSVVLGTGFHLVFKNPRNFILVAAQCAMFWPFAFRLIYPAVKKIPLSVTESALLLSNSETGVFFTITIPYCKRQILSSLALCFAMSAGDTTLPLILGIKDFTPLALFTYRLSSSYRFSHAGCAGIILAAICVSAFFISMKFKDPHIKGKIQ
ncbi:MAG: iron ABC transporter permease [Treponema sp.]|nr:iron ABC transporter permease [Treponema sp.]